MSPWDPIVVGLLVLATLGLAVSSVSRILVWGVVRHHSKGQVRDDRVSILKPLCGVDASLADNLQAFSVQSHANLNIVFGVADPRDEALPVAQRFCREHEGVATHISVGEAPCLHNPKVALLAHMTPLCKGDWVVVSDSNVRVSADYVQDALSHAAPDVGLVTHLVSGAGGSSLSAHLENLQLNCFVAPGICGVRYIAGQTCVIGKSMFLRRDALDAIGGFESAGGYLAEDYVIGRAIRKAGHRVVTARTPVPTWNEGWTFTRFVSRHLRWAVMRRRVSRTAYMVELLLTPGPVLVLVLVLGIWSPATHVNLDWVLAAILLDQVFDFVTYCRMTGQRTPLAAALLNPLRQWLTLAIWALGWFVHTVEWRGKTYRVGVGSRLSPVSNLPSASETSVPR
jgi:ceramide glucosyltransferase